MVKQEIGSGLFVPKHPLLEMRFGLPEREGGKDASAENKAALPTDKQSPPNEHARTTVHSPEIRAFLETFNRTLEQAVHNKDLEEVVRIWETVTREIKRRLDNNENLFNSEHNPQPQPTKEEILEKVFTQKALEIFGAVDEVKGKTMVTTLRGFLIWKIGRFFQAMINRHGKKGERRFGFDLRDDDIQITAEGITIYNPDAGVNRQMTEWSTITQKWDIILDCSWAFDWINSLRSLHWNKEISNTPVYPWGILRIEEAGGDQVFVEVMMRHPDKWADAIQSLKKVMTNPDNFPSKEKPSYLPTFTPRDALAHLTPRLQEKLGQLMDEALSDPKYAEHEMPERNQVFVGGKPISQSQWRWLQERREERKASRELPLIDRLMKDFGRWSKKTSK